MPEKKVRVVYLDGRVSIMSRREWDDLVAAHGTDWLDENVEEASLVEE